MHGLPSDECEINYYGSLNEFESEIVPPILSGMKLKAGISIINSL